MNALLYTPEMKMREAAEPARVLIVDDSVVVRRIISRALADDPRFIVCGAVSSAAQALGFLEQTPVDLILLDVEMAGESGLAVLPRLLAQDRSIRVVILSGMYREGSEAALRALAIGASDVVAKPRAGHFSTEFVDTLVERLLLLVPGDTRTGPTTPRTAAVKPRLLPLGGQVRAIGIGGSTGGIGAVMSVLAGLPARIGVPVFITQHLPPNFQALFASQIAKVAPLEVTCAEDRALVRPDTIYVATGEAHLTVERSADGQVRIAYSLEATAHAAFPSVDPMLGSLGKVYGQGACGILLSGMGRDGLAGATHLVGAGGWIMAQDEESSSVWGMPGSVAKAGLVSAVDKPAEIAALLCRHLPQ
ncbi:chemotaxis protein CheB [Sphingobium sp. CR28]|uniref:chemotaxis protein CheB n=1 Tax=Sphingobium sp. CR28 TaxID=3400272 RepID=UPI003FEF4BD4